jgi:hypothetical protein
MWRCWSSESGAGFSFQPPGRGHLEGVLTRYNRKTVTVITGTGQRWNVSPAVLSRVKSAKGANTTGSNVVPLDKALTRLRSVQWSASSAK